MAAFNVPYFSDDESAEEDFTSTKTNNKQTLFERRKEFRHSTASQESSQIHSAAVTNLTTKVIASSCSSNTDVAVAVPQSAAAAAKVIASSCSSNTDVAGAVPQSAAAAAAKSAPAVEQPQTAASVEPSSSSSGNSAYRILVNKKQKGNPILKFVRNVPWEFDAIVADYELGQGTCALYLSVKYHNRFPNYVHNRLKELGKSYNLRILLVQVDTKQQDISHELNQLARICILADCTLILAFSLEEAGRYLEVYKSYENKPPTEIMGKTKTDFLSQATEFLTCVKGVNKTDVTTLLSRFKTLKAIINADVDSLSLCPGIGPVKARRLHNAFTTSFVKQTTAGKKHGLVSELTFKAGEMEDNSEDEDLLT